MGNITKAQAARIEKHLSDPIRLNGIVMTNREMVDTLLEQGRKPFVELAPAIKPLRRIAFFRAEEITRKIHEQKMLRAGEKAEYFMTCPAGLSSFAISKIQFDYACKVLDDKDAALPVSEEVENLFRIPK